MKTDSCIELPVSCQIAKVRRLTPFHWALLHALQHFPPGGRPSLEALAARLHTLPTSFLADAWRELLEHQAVDDGAFHQARLTLEGREALRQQFLPLGRAEEQVALLYFTEAGVPMERGAPEREEASSPLSTRPDWSTDLGAHRLERLLRRHTQTVRLSADDHLQSAHPLWDDARIVTPHQSRDRVGGTALPGIRHTQPAASKKDAPKSHTE